MTNNWLLSGSIILLFCMLWLPSGDYDFLINNWMKLGTYALPFISVGVFAYRDNNPPLKSDIRFLAFVMLAAYIIHQFEEHWIDLYGNVYAFYSFNNQFILSNLGEPDSAIKPLTKESIFVINTSLVWLIGLIAVLRSPKHLFPFFAMAGIIVINGAVHIIAGLVTYSYNPGLLTSLVVFLPLYLWLIMRTGKMYSNTRKLIVGGLLWAILAHVIMVAGLLAANWFNVIPEYIYWTILVLWSIVPLLIFRNYELQPLASE